MSKIRKYVRSEIFIYVFLALAFVIITTALCLVARPNKIQACEAQYHEPCVLIAIPKSVNDITNDHD